MKHCIYCNKDKPENEFPPKRKRCRKCVSENTKKWVQNNRKRFNEYQLKRQMEKYWEKKALRNKGVRV